MIGDILSCPHCGSSVQRTGEELFCNAHGRIAKHRDGLVDFLYDTAEIRLANAGVWDLANDQRVGIELLEMFANSSYSELKEHARRQMTDAEGFVDDQHARLMKSRLAHRAQRRFDKRYRRVSEEVGSGHGEQMLHKIDTRVCDLNLTPVLKNLAVELAGGDGQYLPGFCRSFEHVVFVDGSLVNVVLARALARDDGLTNASFIRADILSLPVRSSVASMVHANNVIEHVSDPDVLASECARIVTPDGYAVVVSPNRMSVFLEPHFRLPLYGFFPRAVRLFLIPITRGKSSEAGANPLSLGGLRRTLKSVPFDWDIFLVPRGLQSTARSTPLRRILAQALQSPLGGAADWLLNRAFLPLAHCHTAIGRVRR